MPESAQDLCGRSLAPGGGLLATEALAAALVAKVGDLTPRQRGEAVLRLTHEFQSAWLQESDRLRALAHRNVLDAQVGH